mgnify:CR=1 FL=1|tara:strand:- start:4626 stop:5606 length:981 start_codon:yes stop_codon:yes gene_type:complete
MSNLKNVHLATAVNVTTTYAGQFAGEYIAAALLSASTINDGGLTVKSNISYKEVIKKMATSNLVQSASCDFDPTSSITLTERIIQPTELQVNLQICKKDFVNDWESEQMGFGMSRNLPPKFSDFLIARVAAEVAQSTEITLWKGDTAAASNNSFDGFEKLIAASAAAGDIPAGQQVAAVGGGIDAGNVIAELQKVVSAIPNTLYGKEDLFIYVPSSVAKFYVQALGGFSVAATSNAGVDNKGTQWWNNGSLTVDGVKIFVCPGMSDNKMYAAERSNLYFGTGLLADNQQVKVIDMADIDGSQNVRMIMRFTSGVQFGVASDLVEYA